MREPVVYGGVDSKSYIVEVVGCGVAFFDYDNDGWMDLFVLGGTRLEGASGGATNRLYKNNRDGTFTDVTAKAGLTRDRLGVGRDRRRLQQRRIRGIFITYYGHNVLYRNNGDGTFTDVTETGGAAAAGRSATAPAARGWTTTATATSICSSPTI